MCVNNTCKFAILSNMPLGINIFLDGFVPTENLRFRDTSLIFKVSETADWVKTALQMVHYELYMCN